MAIWLIGGTSESRDLAIALAEQDIPFVVTATTESARQLYGQIDRLCDWQDFSEIGDRSDRAVARVIRIGKLSQAELEHFAQAAQISAILDASHPFATEISQLAIAHSHNHQIAYLRFERKDLNSRSTSYPLAYDREPLPPAQEHLEPANSAEGLNTSAPRAFEATQYIDIDKQIKGLAHESDRYLPTPPGERNDSIITIPHLDHLFTPTIANDYLINKNVLLTLGCKSLEKFQTWHDRVNLFARILPQSASIAMAEQAGFTSRQVIAIRPPIGAALEQALWQQWQINTVITKASGRAGGEDIKRSIATKLGLSLIIVARTQLNYPHQTSSIDRAIDFCRKWAIG
ncbi:precorrin-6x reductase [Thalassoporum mexicanum PCC 7367]|uniref:precorrin-6A/cobalt-precorrin-6A reductase n=1 Tax=Thalassoporum mexicanum TaxID=3457544 RepID=UPI00029FC098|nr:precorrin-6A/cobalt-precorrin-6A reductase [Pseudanabaena sp. PCC 7367]AFY68612.1 precorrin-6x reductase [Pseudanabaena sp. PCC 7367]